MVVLQHSGYVLEILILCKFPIYPINVTKVPNKFLGYSRHTKYIYDIIRIRIFAVMVRLPRSCDALLPMAWSFLPITWSFLLMTLPFLPMTWSFLPWTL